MMTQKKDILVIQTGGTLAMADTKSERVGFADAHRGLILQQDVPELDRIAHVSARTLFTEDSSDLNPDHWEMLANFIGQEYHHYDGFVVIHGTDTMAYTASYLSFVLRGLGKPVILTGSQIPLINVRSDARRNLINAVEMATLPCNEVAVCFNDRVLRGNRCTKMSIGDFDAFASPNFPPLAEIGLHIELRNAATGSESDFNVVCGYDSRIAVIKLFPGLPPKLLSKLPESGVRMAILEAFGAGNVPVKGEFSVIPLVESCLHAGMEVVVTSQAAYDAVDLSKYENARPLLEAGALSAGDMTFEATVTKCMHLLAHSSDQNDLRQKFMQNIAGERSV